MLSAEKLHTFLRSRRSVRRFEQRAIPRETIESLLETATWAPSSHNRQPWRFVVLAGAENRARLADEMGADFRRDLAADGVSEEEIEAQVGRSRARLLEAPLAIVLCLDLSAMDCYPDPARQAAEHGMGVQSVALAGGLLLLAAHAEGLGGVWVCAPLFAPQATCRALALPAAWEPQGLLLLGYPAGIPGPRPRRTVQQVTTFL